MNSKTIILGTLLLIASVLHAQSLMEAEMLIEAVSSGDESSVAEQLARGVNPNQPNAAGRLPLVLAVSMGHHSLTARLLEGAADPNQSGIDGISPLVEAVMKSRRDLVVLLMSWGADLNRVTDASQPVSALSAALNRGEYEIARLMVDAGADAALLADPAPGVPNPLRLPQLAVPLDARLWRNRAALEHNANSPDWNADDWPLQHYANTGNWFGLLNSLDAGMDANTRDSRGVTALMCAAWQGRNAELSLLLQRGADSDLRDRDGRAALSYAAAAGHASTVDLLLTPSGAGLSPANLESSPCYYAVAGGHRRILNRLLRAGVSPLGVDEEGATLLMIAAWLGDSFSVQELLPLVDGAQRDHAGRTALEWSAAAFSRDRRTGREVGQIHRGSRIYPIARLLARRARNPFNLQPQPSPDIHPEVMEAWSVSHHAARVEDWQRMSPSPIPFLPGDGDLTLYRIFRDEEAGLPSAE